MYKYLTLVYVLTITTAALHADDDFCIEDKPCDLERVLPCPYCPSSYYGNISEAEELQKAVSWPTRNEDPFMEALSR